MEAALRPHLMGASLIYFPTSMKFRSESQVYMYLKQTEKIRNEYYDEDVRSIEEFYFSGPMRYGCKEAIDSNKQLVSVDLITAYARILRDSVLPGRKRTRYDGMIHPQKGEVGIVTLSFAEREPDERLEVWFLNQAAFKKRLITKYEDVGIKGLINIIIDDEGTELLQIFKQVAPSAKVVYTVIAKGEPMVYINREALRNLIRERNNPYNPMRDEIKKMLASSTGFLAHLDKISYYYMVQKVKKIVIIDILSKFEHDEVVGINTDGVILCTEFGDTRYNDFDNRFKIEKDIDVKFLGSEVFVE